MAAFVFAPAQAEPVDAILTRMNTAAKQFKSVSASMHQLDYNFVLKESTPSDATLRIRRNKGAFQGVLEYKPPDPRTIAFAGKEVKIYDPKAHQVQVLNAGNFVSHFSEFFLFGTSGTELQKTYTITGAGAESIGSVPTTHLVLTPKSADLQRMIGTLDVWIPDGTAYPIQEKAVETTSHNMHTYTFSDVTINPRLPESAFEFKIPPGTKVINER